MNSLILDMKYPTIMKSYLVISFSVIILVSCNSGSGKKEMKESPAAHKEGAFLSISREKYEGPIIWFLVRAMHRQLDGTGNGDGQNRQHWRLENRGFLHPGGLGQSRPTQHLGGRRPQ